MSAVIIIPARYGSSRFPGKPLVLIDGQTLVERVYRRACLSEKTNSVYIATDDQRISAHVESFGGRVIMTPPNIASGTDRIAKALPEIEQRELIVPDVVVNVQGDEPLIDMKSVDALIDAFDDRRIDMATLACPINSDEEFNNRDVVKVVTSFRGDALYFSRAPIPFGGREVARRHVGVYAYRRQALLSLAGLDTSPLEIAESLEQLRALQNGFTIRVLETDKPHLGVDSPEDVARVEDELRKTD